jgi:alpha-L-glutamate ligase-like protein
MKLSSILGLNARFTFYSSVNNSRRGKKVTSSKLATKKALIEAGIPTPQVFAKFRTPERVYKYNWDKLPNSFAFKPSRGLGGEGIIVVKKKTQDKEAWLTTNRKRVTPDDLQLHALDILEGAYSTHNVPDMAFVEEYVGRHKAFRRWAYRGTPDIRVIVFNKIPVMAMLRLPTRESGGRANLHQGAIAAGIDIATGITTYAVWHREIIRYKPGTKKKLHGIKIPHWDQVLEIAVKAQIACGQGYVGVDIIMHPERGPMVLELNSEPGLDIQLANMAGLRKRLDRVEDLKIVDAEHGVRIAKSLFASAFAARVRAESEGQKIVGVFEEIKLKGADGSKLTIKAKIDTGAYRSSIDRSLAEQLGLLQDNNVLWTRFVKSALGRQKRPVIHLTYWLKGRKIVTTAGVADRKRMNKPFIVGRRDLAGFLVVPPGSKNS